MINGNFSFPKQPIAKSPRLLGMYFEIGYYPTIMKRIITITTLSMLFLVSSLSAAMASPTNTDAKRKSKTSMVSHAAMRQGSSLTTQFEAAEAGPAMVTVKNAAGKTVLEREFDLNSGINRLKLRLSDLSEGYYLIKVQTPDQTEVHSVVLR